MQTITYKPRTIFLTSLTFINKLENIIWSATICFFYITIIQFITCASAKQYASLKNRFVTLLLWSMYLCIMGFSSAYTSLHTNMDLAFIAY